MRRFFSRYRRLFAGVLGLLAMLAAIGAARPAPTETTDIVVVTRPIEAGYTLTQDDLEIVSWPLDTGAVGSYFTDRQEAVGRMTAGPIAQGEPLNTGRIVGPSLLSGTALDPTKDSANDASSNGTAADPSSDEVPIEHVAAIVRLADKAYLALARPGDTVDILAADTQAISDFEQENPTKDSTSPAPAMTIAKSARVLAIPGSDAASGLGTAIGLNTQNTEAVVVLAVDRQTAAALAGAASRYRLSMVVIPAQPASPTTKE